MPPFKQAVQSQPHATPRRPRMRAWPVLIFCSIAAAGILGTATLVRAAVGISATKTYAFIGGDGDGKADPGETLEYTVVVANSSGSDVTGVQFNDNPDANTTFVPGSITASPIAANDTFPQTVVGNVAIDSSLIAYSVTSNDFLGLNPAATISAYDATSANGGQVTMTTSGAGIGAFTYNPPPGFEGTDTFSYTISNVNGSNTATVSISVSGMVWFVNNNAAACTTLAAGCGRLSLPFSSLAAFNALNNGAGTNPAANDAIFIYESGTAYAGGVTLLSGQKLIGQDATATLSVITGLTPPSSSAAFPAMNTGGNATTVQNGAGNAVTLNQNNTIRGLTISGTSGAGMLGTGISALTVGSDVRLTGVAGADLDLSGAASGTISFGASVTNSSGRAISIQNRSGGSVDLAGAISDSGGTGVLLNSNTGAIITFSGGISLSTGANAAFTATNGGTIHVCDENPCNPAATGALVNTLTTTTGTALNIANTTIGANNLEFRSISANGASNGIVLTATGAAGGLAVKGDAGSANNSSGGTIQNTVGDAISLSSAQNITLDQMTIQSTGGSGINGTQVTNFAFTNGAISNAGNAGFESAIAFNGAGTGFGNNIAGSLTLTGNTLTNPFYSGLDVQSDAGTVTSATVSNNTISNPGFSGINFVGIGTALTAFNLARATIDQNNIASSGGNGIQVSIGNANASGPGATAGSLATGLDIIAITNNSISIDSIGTQAIAIANSGGNSASRTKTNFIIQCNGKNTGGCTAPTANPLTGSSIGTDILVGNNGYADMVGTIDNNSIDANHTANLGGGNGIGGGNGVAGAGNAWTPHLTLIVTNNTISDTDGNGILLVGRGTSGTANFKVANNTVAMPINAGGSARPGIRIDAGNSSSGDDAVCLNITGNTSAGSNGASGLGLRKQGTVATTNDFGIQNVSPATPTNADVQSFVNGLNAFGGGTDIINGSNFVQCAVPAIAVTHTNSHQAAAQRQAQASMIAYAPAPRPSSDSANGAAASSGGARGVLAPLPAPAQAGGATPRRHTSQPAPAQAGGIVNLNIGTLPAGKSITIKFRVTVNDPLTLGATQLANQGAISYDPAQTILTDDPAIGGASDATITVIDRPDTTVASINRASGNPSNNATVTWQVVLAAPIDGLTASNFNLVNSGLGGAPAITGVTPASGPPATTWNITASTGTGQGTLGLNIANDTGLSHDLTNAPFTGEVFTIDHIAPTTTSFTRQTPASSLTNADTLVFRVTFSEQVTGVGPADFAATGTTATVTSIGAGGPGGPYDVTVSGGDLASYNGVVGLNFSGAMSITDLAGNPAASSEPATDETYTLDNTGPAATIDQAAGQTDPTNSTSISFTVSFSEAVTGFDSAADIDLSASTAPGTLQAVITGGPAIYTVAVSGMTGDGTVVASIPAGAAIDGAANLSAASTSSDNSVSYDSTAPSATINQAAGQADPTASSPVSFTVVFSEPVADFATGDVALSGSAGATTAVVTGGPTTYTVAVSGMTGDGTVIANLAAGVAHDAAGNANLAATSTDNSVLYDTVAPSVTINQAAGQADPTNASPIGYIVVFSEAVSGFATGDVTLDSPFGALTGAVSEIAPMNGTTYAVAVTGMAGSGTITATIAPGAATDLAGQPNGASSSTDNTVSFDDLRPNTTIDSNPLNPTSSTSASFSFSGTDTGSGVAGFGCSLDGGGFSACTSPQNYSSLADGSHTFQVRASDSAGNVDASPASFTWVVDASAPATNITASPANPTNNSSASFSFTGADGSGVGIAGFGCSLDGGGFSACTSPQNYSSLADGSHTFQVRAIDAAGNIDPTPATFTWTIDTTAPTVALTSATSSSTNAAPILVSITFSEPVDIGTGVGDLSITNGSATTPVGSGTTYTFSLTPSGQGPVTAVYLAGSAFDAAGNPNLVSNTFSITYDTIAPSVTIEQAAAQPDPTSASPINFTVTFSEAVADFSGANVTLGGTAGATTALVTGSGTTYNVAVSGMTGSGTVIATIPANAAQDAAGNTSTAATSTDNTVAFVYDPVAPVVASIARADASPSNAASVQFTVTFSKNVTGVDTSDFRLTSSGVAGATITGVVGSGTTWTVTSATGSGDGTLRLDLIDDDTILDAANNPLGGTGASNGDFTSGEVYTIDKTAPQAGNLAAANITTSGGTTHSFTVVFSDNLAIDTASLDGSDIQVSGPGGFNQLAALVSVAPAGNGTPRTATYRISAPGGVWDTADNGSYTVALQANQVRDTTGNQAAGGVLGTFSVGASAPQHTTFLPFVLRPGAPDLVMSIGISPDKRSFKAGEPVVVSVTVTNQGDAPAGAFWVDLYINPSSPPTAANQIWNTRCGLTPCFGMAWPVPNGLAPGQSITLSSQSVPASYSAWPGWFAAGTSDLYGYADSYNPGVATGAVAERDETNNRAELHGLSVTGRNPGLARPRSVADRSARPAQPVK